MSDGFFIPKEFKGYPVQQGFSGISHNIYRSANSLLDLAQQEGRTISFHVLSAVVLFTTTLESYFNETLTVNLLAEKYNDRTLVESLRRGSNLRFHEKIRRVFLIYDRNQAGIDTNGDTYRDIVALGNLRNRIVHYNPDWENMYKYPKELQHILKRTKIDLLRSGLITNFSNIIVGQWAKSTVKSTLTEFSLITGAHNPFTNDPNFKSTRWED